MFSITKNKLWFTLIPVLIIVAGIIGFFVNGGFKQDIDFAGGTMMQINIGQEFETADVEAIITEKTGKKVDISSKSAVDDECDDTCQYNNS